MKNKCSFPEIAIIARPCPTLEHLLEDAHKAKKEKLSDLDWTREAKHGESGEK